MLFHCNCCRFYFIPSKGWGKEKRLKYKSLSSQSVWCFVITTRRCWPSWQSRWWRKIRTQLVQAQKKLRDRSRWDVLILLSHDETWTRMILVLLWFFLCVSVTCGQIWASLDEDQPAGRREWGEEDEGGSSERGDPHVSRFTVASVAIVKPNSSWWASVGLWKLIVCVLIGWNPDSDKKRRSFSN